MNKKGFKTITSVSACVMVLLMGMVLSSSSCIDEKPVDQKPTKKTIRYICPPDSVVADRLSDTVCTILFTAKKATVYKVNPSLQPRDNDITIGGVVVEKSLGRMNSQSLYALQLFLSDKSSYGDGPVVPLTPYAPTIAVELSGAKGSIYLMFSLLSQEVGVVCDGLLVATYSYRGRGLMAKLFRQYISKDYLNYLNSL